MKRHLNTIFVTTQGSYLAKEGETIVIKAGDEIKLRVPVHTVNMLEETLRSEGKELNGAKVAILGVAFLENSDDTRNSPSRIFYDELKKRGAEPAMHDHLVREFERPFSNDLDAVLEGADAVILAVKHSIYADLDFGKLRARVRTAILIDGRNFFDRKKVEHSGFIYRGVGKP